MSNSLLSRVTFGLDIGGSLAKICVFEPHDNTNWTAHDRNKISYLKSKLKYGTTGIRDKTMEIELSNGKLHFIHFQTHKYMEAIQIISNNNLLQPKEPYWGTGGGVHKYAPLVKTNFNVNINHGDELKCLLSGLNFLLTNVNDECYYMEDQESKQPSNHMAISMDNNIFPYILVNIGSGVSILKIKNANKFDRVSGSQIGGGTFWGLCKLFIGNISYKKAFDLTKKGETENVNMLVKDIYGGDYSQFNLPGDIVASAFGKCGPMKSNQLNNLNKNDISKGLLDMIAMNVAQLGYLNAIRFGINKIIFAGNFLRQNDLSRAIVSWAIYYWSKGKMKAYFLKHEGYCGALGVLLAQHEKQTIVSKL
eukprot:132900_1